MSPTNLVYWLAGYLELSDKNTGMTAEQVDTIRRHLALVLTNVTDDTTIGPETYVEGHDVGYVPTEEEMDEVTKYAFRTLSKNHPEAAYNETLPIQTCLTC